MVQGDSQATLLAGKQAALQARAAAGKDVSAFDPNVIMDQGNIVYQAAPGKSVTIPGTKDTLGLQAQVGTGLGAGAGIVGGINMGDLSSVDFGNPGNYLGGVLPNLGAGGIGDVSQLQTAIGEVPLLLGPGGGGGALATLLGIGTGLAAVGGGVYGVLQALGLGAGGGLFGNNLLGGDTSQVNGITIGGPGQQEPSASSIIKEWVVNYSSGQLHYWLVQVGPRSRKILLYNSRTGKYKAWSWRPPRLAVIGKNMPKHRMIVRLRRNLKKHTADARTLLQLTSPSSLAHHRRSRTRVVYRHHRR